MRRQARDQEVPGSSEDVVEQTRGRFRLMRNEPVLGLHGGL